MYPLGHVAELLSIVNVAIGMFMAHTIHRCPHRLRRCVAVWTLIFAVCIAIGEVLNVLLPQFTEQWLAAFTGCIFIVGYIYLFPDIPLPQRIFNYFLAVDFMYMIVLVARTAAMLLVGYFALPSDLAFTVCYLSLAAAFLIFYRKWLKSVIQQGLAAFQKNLMSLTVFGVVSYFGTLFMVDVWAPWPALTFYTALPYLGLIALNLGGYVLAFRTLIVMGQRLKAQSETKMAQFQLALAEKEYHATMEGIGQVRRMRHDMNHHLTALSALIAGDDKAGALEYIEKAAQLLPQRPLSDENPITGSFVERYRELCEGEGIAFSAEMNYSEAQIINKVHLGILLGNSLENAYDAAEDARGKDRFVSIEGKQIYDNLVLTVQNGFSGAPNRELISTKGEGHGLGISSMKNVVEEYGGYLNVNQENGIFTLNMVLTIQK